MKDDHLLWKKTDEKEFRGAYKRYLTRYFMLPDGTMADFDVTTLKSGKFAMCLALTDDMKVVVAKQFRPGPQKVIYDMPAGILEPGESAEEGIRRELLEETGHTPAELIALNPDGNVIGPYDDALGVYFLALGCKRTGKQKLDANERAEVGLLPLRTYVHEVLRKGLATHADCGWLAIDRLMSMGKITYEDIKP